MAMEPDEKINGYGSVHGRTVWERQEAGIMMIVVSVLVFMGALVASLAPSS